jgi:hypothetical protein
MSKISPRDNFLKNFTLLENYIASCGRDLLLKKQMDLMEEWIEEKECTDYTWRWLEYKNDRKNGGTPTLHLEGHKTFNNLIECVDSACRGKWFWPQSDGVFHVLHIKKKGNGVKFHIRVGALSPESAPFLVPDISPVWKLCLTQRDAIFDLYDGRASLNGDCCCSDKEFIILETYEEPKKRNNSI